MTHRPCPSHLLLVAIVGAISLGCSGGGADASDEDLDIQEEAYRSDSNDEAAAETEAAAAGTCTLYCYWDQGAGRWLWHAYAEGEPSTNPCGPGMTCGSDAQVRCDNRSHDTSSVDGTCR